uniref:Uncharacterized protein n=1 Tax=Seriola dumerili TaxID=41447 RepID=A0A3B4T942_SERDU
MEIENIVANTVLLKAREGKLFGSPPWDLCFLCLPSLRSALSPGKHKTYSLVLLHTQTLARLTQV